jgi:hypothetical protein
MRSPVNTAPAFFNALHELTRAYLLFGGAHHKKYNYASFQLLLLSIKQAGFGNASTESE